MASNIAATSPGRLSRSPRDMPQPYGWSQQRRTLPGPVEDVLGEEREDGLVPDPRVARGQDPVVLVGEVKELGLHAVPGQVPPQPQRLAYRHPVVLVAVDDEHPRTYLLDATVRRVHVVHLRPEQRIPELRPPEHRVVRGAEHLVKRPQPGVAHDRLD